MQMSVPSAAAAVEFDGALVREPIEKISLPPPEGDAKNESEEEEEVVQPKHKRRKVDYRLLEIASPPRRASTRITPDVPVALRVQQKNRAAAAAAAAAAFSAIIKH